MVSSTETLALITLALLDSTLDRAVAISAWAFRKAALAFSTLALAWETWAWKMRRVDLGDELAFFHLGIVIGVKLLDRPRNLGSHQDGDDRVDRAVGRDIGGNAAPFHLDGPVFHARLPIPCKNRCIRRRLRQ